jgi:hypothetical protein
MLIEQQLAVMNQCRQTKLQRGFTLISDKMAPKAIALINNE